MKIIINRSALQEALNAAQSVTSARSPKPVLQCVKLTAEGDTVTLAATDLELSLLVTTASVQVEQPGVILVPADKLRDIVRESTDETLSIELVGEQAHIKGSDSHFKIFTQSPADFPPVDGFDGDPTFTVVAGTLKRMIGQTVFAAAKDATRFAFNGAMVTIDGKRLAMVATDGRRLSMAKGDVTGLAGDKPAAIIPARALALLDRMLPDPDEPVSVRLTDNRAVFRTDGLSFATNVIEGVFPPYNDVIPKECDRKMAAGTADLLSAVRRSALLTTQVTKGVRMSFGASGLTISSRDPDAGEATINFACRLDGAPMDIGFNPAFFVEGLKAANTDEITFEMLAPNRPGLMRAGADYAYVIMPVNLS